MTTLNPSVLASNSGASPVRKASVAGSTISGVSGTRRNIQSEFDFNLGLAKSKVLKALQESVPAAFVHFYQGQLFDRLLHGLILYLCAMFQHEALVRCMERSRQQHLDGYNPYLVAARLKELEDEAAAQRMGLSQPYCEVIMKHSSYKKPQRDKLFFEALYDALQAVLDEAFERVGKQAITHQELGRLFRGRHFNIAARTDGPQRSVDSLTVTQIWSLKNETENRSLHAKLITGLYEKPKALGVQVASLSNTPLLSQAVVLPMVTRSLLADPQERDALLALPYSRNKKHVGGQKMNNAVKAVAAAQGLDLNAVATPAALKQLQPTAGTLNAAGIKPPEETEPMSKHQEYRPVAGHPTSSILKRPSKSLGSPSRSPSRSPYRIGIFLKVEDAAAGAFGSSPRRTGTELLPAAANNTNSAGAAPSAGAAGAASSNPRSSTLKPFQSTVASLPEAAGLPYDENYAYLCLLRRYVIYGPQLGLATGPPLVGRQPGMSMTGSALAAGMGQDALSTASSAVFS